MASDPDEIHEITDFSAATLAAQIERLLASSGPEQLVYRECELDEIWRLLDLEITSLRADGTSGAELSRLESLRQSIMQVHDLVGVEGDVVRAAQRLREIVQ